VCCSMRPRCRNPSRQRLHAARASPSSACASAAGIDAGPLEELIHPSPSVRAPPAARVDSFPAAAAGRHDAGRSQPPFVLNSSLRTNPMPITHHKPAHLHTPPGVIAAIIGLSAAASALICWLVYFHAPTDVAGTHLRWLPLVNAVLNALATVALVTGFHEIRERRILHHRASMSFAFLFSSIFLVSYLVNFTLHGETHLPIAPHRSALDQLRHRALLDATSRWPSLPCPWSSSPSSSRSPAVFPRTSGSPAGPSPSGSTSRSAASTSTFCKPSSADAAFLRRSVSLRRFAGKSAILILRKHSTSGA